MDSCNSDYACFAAAVNGDIPSGIIGCCNTAPTPTPTPSSRRHLSGGFSDPGQGICYLANEATLFTQDSTCSSAPVSVSATDDSGSDLIDKGEVALDLDDFLSDLEHEIYKLVKELAKNKKD